MKFTTPDNTLKIVTTLVILVLSSLACEQAVTVITPTAPPSSPTASPLPATATLPPSATATEDGQNVAVVRQPVVRVRDAEGGKPTGEYITAGQKVNVLQISGDWVQIENPPGWVYIGCLEGLSDKGCEADE